MLPEADYRALARDFLVIACGSSPLPSPDEARKAIGDPVYEAITEGRQQPALDYNVKNAKRIDSGELKRQFYSSCGDLPHWLFEMLGVRLPLVNRASLGRYRVGQNVTLLCGHLGHAPHIGEEFAAGDVIVVNIPTPATTHVHVVAELESDVTWVTANYGQPGGALRRIQPALIPGSEDRFKLGSRTADWALDLWTVLLTANEAGALVEPENPAAWLAKVAP